MSTDTFSRHGKLDTSEKARLAVAEFRRMIPTLSSYARALTGKDNVQVVMSGYDNGSTDGSKIYFRPPIELSEQYEHERRLCDKRGDNGLQLCDACRVREDILSVIYHEIAHIAFDSFKQPRPHEIARAIEIGFAGRTDEWSSKKAQAITDAPSYVKNSWLQLANVVSSYLPMLVNCIEDARVNKAMFEARNGIQVMFQATVDKIFNEGFEAADGRGGVRTVRWNEQPLNSQVMIGVFCKVSGYDYADWFSAPVLEALADPELERVLRGMKTVRSVANVYTLSITTLIRLRELGFLLEPSEMEPEPEPEEDEESDADSEPESDDEEESDESGESEEGESDESATGSGDDGSSPEEHEDSESGGDGSSEDDDSDDDSGDASGEPGDDDASDGQPGEDASVDHSADSAGDESASAGHAGSDERTEDDLPDGEGGESNDLGGPEGDKEESGGLPSSSPGSGTDPERTESEESESVEGSSPGDEEDDVEFESGDEWQNDLDDEDENYTDPTAVRMVDDPSNDNKPIPEYGTPEDVEVSLLKFGEHDTPPTHVREGAAEEAIEVAIIQGIYFETDSRFIRGVRFHPHTPGKFERTGAWGDNSYNEEARECDLTIPEPILGKALLKARRVFEDNARAKNERNRKNGRVNARSLGRRAPFDDERLFKKRLLPGKKDYCVIIGVDVSGSTVGKNIVLEKQAVAAQAEMLHRLGIEFAIFAHSGNYHDPDHGREAGLDLDIYPIKELHEPWDIHMKRRLQDLGSAAANLDGHALEFLRKRADESRATDKIILYYSDGQMPAENRDEELTILQREIRTCRTKGYTLLGVGIRTDSPKEHGLDTVQVDTSSDLSKVVDHLERRLV